MLIEFKCGVAHLGYAYKKGARAASLPDAKCKELIEMGVAFEIETPKKKKPAVRKAVIDKSTTK